MNTLTFRLLGDCRFAVTHTYIMTCSNIDILKGCRKGAPWAITLVSDFITPIIRHKLFSFHDWEDVRQHCIMEILDALRTTKRVKNFWGLVRKITICTVIDYNRKQQVHHRVFTHSTDDMTEKAFISSTGNPSPRDDPQKHIESKDLFLYIFQRLENTCQEIIKGLFMRGLSYAELSDELGISEVNLRIRLMRCRKKARQIRDQLQREE